jgi:hypothetical protein
MRQSLRCTPFSMRRGAYLAYLTDTGGNPTLQLWIGLVKPLSTTEPLRIKLAVRPSAASTSPPRPHLTAADPLPVYTLGYFTHRIIHSKHISLHSHSRPLINRP